LYSVSNLGAVLSKTLRWLIIILIIIIIVYVGDPKLSRNCQKNVLKMFVQILNFSPLGSTHPATGCSNPSTAPTAGNIV
jgi:hypothetical protein